MLFLFRGGYLTESNMLGHEIINLFQDDDGHHYIYVVPWGLVGRDHVDKVGTIILARHIGNSQVEIIAKAKVKGEAFPGVNLSRLGLKNITNQQDENKIKELKKRKQIHGKFCKGISYGGKEITDIYHYYDDNDIQQILVSYEVENFRFSNPDENTNQLPRLSFNSNNGTNDDLIAMKSNMAKTSLKAFITRNSQIENELPKDKKEEMEKMRDDFKTLNELVKDSRYWEPKDNSKMISTKDYSEVMSKNPTTFLTLIGKEDSEIVFSRLLCHYFSCLELMNTFINNVLGKYGVHEVDKSFIVTQEEDRIDIRIQCRDQTIVIENKIKSDINGRNKKLLESDNMPKSQLSVYYKKYEDNGKFFIFVPEYNKKRIEHAITQLSRGKYYHVISYKEIHTFFEDKRWDGIDQYINEFRNALLRHASNQPDTLQEETRRKFLERIIELKNAK